MEQQKDKQRLLDNNLNQMESKTLIYCKQGAIESPETVEEISGKQLGKDLIKAFINKTNPETGRMDKYLCNCYVYEVSHIVDLRGELITENETVKKIEEIIDKKNKTKK